MLRLSLGSGFSLAAMVLVFLLNPRPVRHPLEENVIYSASGAGGVVEFDLPFENAQDQYLVVTTNTSRQVQPVWLSISATPIHDVELIPLSITELSRPRRISARIERFAPAARSKTPTTMRTFEFDRGDRRAGRSDGRIRARLAANGSTARVYVDQRDEVTDETAKTVLHTFETKVRPTVSRYLGLPRDVDRDGGFTILLTSELDRMDDGRVSLGGMVRSGDYRNDGWSASTGSGDVMYLNASVRPGRHLETLLVHEFAHAVTASARLSSGEAWLPQAMEEAWLNEAIAHVSENLQGPNWSNLDHRVARYLANPEFGPLVVSDYASAGLWRDPAARGSTFLFLRWCVERYGTGLLSQLVHGDSLGCDNLAAATGESFEDLHRQFAAELFLHSCSVRERASEADDELSKLDLFDRVGAFDVAGPRFDLWTLRNDAKRDLPARVSGTASRYLVIAAREPGVHRIRVEAEAAESVDVALIRLPRSMARLELDMVPHPAGGWQLIAREHCGQDVRLQRITCTSLDAAGVANQRPRQFVIREDRLSMCFDESFVPAGGEIVSRPVQFAIATTGRLLVQVDGLDEAGHRVTAWCELDTDEQFQQLARLD